MLCYYRLQRRGSDGCSGMKLFTTSFQFRHANTKTCWYDELMSNLSISLLYSIDEKEDIKNCVFLSQCQYAELVVIAFL